MLDYLVVFVYLLAVLRKNYLMDYNKFGGEMRNEPHEWVITSTHDSIQTLIFGSQYFFHDFFSPPKKKK